MATQVQLRRGNTAQISAFTGAIGEVTYDTDRQTLVAHDGITVGGIPLSTESLAIAAFNRANTSNDVLLIAGVYDKANAANLLAYGTGIGANAYSDSVGSSANNFAGSMANASNAYAASLTPDLSPVFLVANAAFDKANAANVLAYNALPKTGGTVSGDMVVTGNLTVSGETTYANTQTLLIGDNIFVVNADLPNDVAPSEDAGMEVNRGSSTDVSLKWNESTDKWVFTNDGSTFVNIASNTDVESKVSSVTGTTGQIFSSGGTTPTLNLITTAVTSGIYGGSTQIPVVNIDEYGRITSASNVAVQGMDYAYVNSSIDIANAYSRVFANSVGTAANTYSNTKVDTITSNSTSRIWANSVTVSGIETVYMDLSTSGVTAAVYGNASIIPVITVDAYGRVTAVTNTAVSASGGGGVTVNNESSSASTYYPLFTTSSTGSVAYANVSNTGLYFVPSTGTLSATIFNSLSDITLKTDIEGFDGIVLLEDVNPVSFTWKQTGSKSYGVIAQELEKVLPELVETNDSGLKSVSYIPMIAMLIDAVKKQEERITKLEQLLNAK